MHGTNTDKHKAPFAYLCCFCVFGVIRVLAVEALEDLEAVGFDQKVEGAGEEEVTDQDRGLVAPHHAGRRLAAAHVALVDDIVMQQRRRVHEFDRGRELDVMVALVAEHGGGRERQHRPQALATGRNQMVGDFRDHLDI